MFYVIRPMVSKGTLCRMLVYSALGEQKASTGWTGGILDLSIEAARACTGEAFRP